jgi:hypothetical protein
MEGKERRRGKEGKETGCARVYLLRTTSSPVPEWKVVGLATLPRLAVSFGNHPSTTVDRPRSHVGRHLSPAVGVSGRWRQARANTGLLNRGQQSNAGVNSNCRAAREWVFISQPPGVQHKQRFLSWRGGAWWAGPFGKHLPTLESSTCQPPSRLTFPSFLRVEGLRMFRHLDCETCRCVEPVQLLCLLLSWSRCLMTSIVLHISLSRYIAVLSRRHAEGSSLCLPHGPELGVR